MWFSSFAQMFFNNFHHFPTFHHCKGEKKHVLDQDFLPAPPGPRLWAKYQVFLLEYGDLSDN